jgi:putative heme-binding domain-containing protein
MRFSLILPLLMVYIFSCRVEAQPLIAETPPLTPAEERAKFHLPPGFEIELVAQEPDIHKPMNMKFDAHGRLWVTHSLEYPFPAKSDEKARDAISIFSEFAPNGKAQKVQRFAEHLNIPIGVVPLSDTDAIAWSIPNIWHLKDTNGDGVADQKTVEFGPFGVRDTHGDQNAFTRWIDGWIYANHGYSNDSHVKIGGKGPDVLHMNSGNTYRFRPDGSAIEQYSWGQVNPFGMSFDSLGNLFTADCHSCAVTMLLREGYYQSFGKPHDGLGFAPEITHIDHGGTGIAGVVYSTIPQFPKNFRDVLFVGNVITNRVHCDRVKWNGSTPVVTKVENFLTSDDPWFRPVDIQQGPDGALYIADFYNCIIGHYEVPLTHPKRDRERGRIWRVVYKGEGDKPGSKEGVAPMPDLDKLDASGLFAMLKHPNLTVRVLATNLLVDKFPKEAATMSSDLLAGELQAEPDNQYAHTAYAQAAHAAWILMRTTGLSEPIVRKVMAAGALADVQVHMVRALGETAKWESWQFETVRNALVSADPFVKRAAAEALSKHPAVDNVLPLLAALEKNTAEDAELYHTIRIGLRDQLRDSQVAAALSKRKLEPKQRTQLVAFAATAPSGPAALLVFDEALHGKVSDDILKNAVSAGARYIDKPRIDPIVGIIQKRFANDPTQQISLLKALADGLSARGMPLTVALRNSLTQEIKSVLEGGTGIEWYNTALPDKQATPSPWGVQQRNYADGDTTTMAICSFAEGGERMGGVLHSPTFALPEQLTFWMCGHNGLPEAPDRHQNYARLILENGTEVARSYPPRNDTAQKVEWNLSRWAGQRGHVEVVDGITDLDGFAWVAVSRFEPHVISVPSEPVGEAGTLAADLYRLVGRLKLSDLMNDSIAASGKTNKNLLTRMAATDSLVMMAPERAIAPLSAILADASLPKATREQAAQQLSRIDRADARAALLGQLKSSPESVALLIAAGLAGNKASAGALLSEIRNGRASATLLREPTVVDRLKSSGLADVDKQIAELTAGLSPKDNRIEKLIAERRTNFLAGKFDPAAGRAVFAKSVCANCHKIGDVGKTLGPGLDGIGSRGLDRLLEDTLDPSRNVDVAFRTVTIETDAGQILSGFGLREEGKELVLSDAGGQPVRVPLANIVDRTQTALSPMPSNMIEQMPERDYDALLAYLLSLKDK